MKKNNVINEINNKEMNETMNLNTSNKKNCRTNLSRLAALILSVTLTSAAVPCQICSADEWSQGVYTCSEGNLDFYYCEDLGGYAVSCTDKTVESVTIPAEVNGVPVTALRGGAFSECTNLKTIEIPDSVVSVGDDAFFGTQWLEDRKSEKGLVIVNGTLVNGQNAEGNVVIPDTVTSISALAFRGNEKMLTIQIPDTVTRIGENAFDSCSNLTSADVSENIDVIPAWMFSGCSSLTTVNIPEDVTAIETGAFCGCKSLENADIPETVGYIGGFAFDNTRWLENRASEDPCVVVNGILIDAGECKGSVVIPDGVTVIGNRAFNINDDVKKITLPASSKLIDEEAFYSCKNLRTLDIPDSVEEIGNSAFLDCSNLRTVTIPESVKKLGNNAFNGCDSLRNLTVKSRNCVIDSGMALPYGTVVYGYKGSTAEEYAVKNGLFFSALDNSETIGQNTPAGDVNKDEAVTNADFVACVLDIISGSPAEESGSDINADGKLDVTDLLVLRNILIA
ncbi:MAG: leucine-rich repeat protein [Oscillospiraceae bacterium]|nr:leucine-rich repeat protein [Oscillospiraceae bacterium]